MDMFTFELVAACLGIWGFNLPLAERKGGKPDLRGEAGEAGEAGEGGKETDKKGYPAALHISSGPTYMRQNHDNRF